MDVETCQHEHVRSDVRETSHCRYIPSHWERETDDDCIETVTVRDTYWYCVDCGELLDVECGD